MEGLSKEFKELKESFQQLKGENAVLRKEILGIGSSAASSGEKGMGLMEKTTLRELVEEIQFDVKALNAKVERNLQEEECSGNGNKPSGEKRGDLDLPYADSDLGNTRDPLERYPVVDIKFKTIEEQRDWMKKIFSESVEQRSVSEGASFGGRTVQAISSSIVPNPTDRSTSCTIKLTNHLSYSLTDPSFYFWYGSKTSGPSKVDPHISEVFTFHGNETLFGGYCHFMCSFGVSSSLCLTIYSDTDCNGSIEFGMAFTPQDAPTDRRLYGDIGNISSAPDIWMHTRVHKMPIEVIIHHGKLHARGQMTLMPFSVIHIDIMEVSDTKSRPFPSCTNMKALENGESISTTLTSGNLLQGSSLNKLTCIIEIGNCLNCTLKNRSAHSYNRARYNFFPSEIRPFYRERLFASDNNKTLEAIFSYEIESTDLCLVVALRVQSGNNSFAVAFDRVPIEKYRDEFLALKDPEAWKIHLYKRYAHAKDGEQVIEIRNIRASVKMTEDAESLLNIRIFAV